MDVLKQLKELSAPMCTAGDEGEISRLFARKIASNCTVAFARGGGVLGAMKGGKSGPRILASAAMDQAGFIVNQVYSNGTVSFLPIGRMDCESLPGSRMVLHTATEKLYGIVPSITPHAKAVIPPERANQKILCLAASEESVTRLARVGDRITFVNDFVEMQRGMVASASLSSRACLACILALCGCHESECRVFLGGASDGRLSHSGTAALAKMCEPDIGIVIQPIPESKVVRCGEGPVIGIGSSSLPKLATIVAKEAENISVAVQPMALYREMHMESWALQTCGMGVRTIVLGIPVRNINTQYEIVSLQDVQGAIELTKCAVKCLCEETRYGV